jgi:universal stress protein A
MKTIHAPRNDNAAKILVTAKGHQATAPASSLAPARFHIAKILVPVDFSEHSRKALHYALEFAAQFDAEVTLAHIVEQMIYPGDWMAPQLAGTDFAHEKREELNQRLQALTKDSPIRVQHVLRFGRAWQEIIEIAKEQKIELIITGTHGYTGLRHALLGSVAEKIVRHAPCPVLIVRPNERDFV